MNVEMNLLREISACKKQLCGLKKDILQQALKSFSTAEISGGTYAQVLKVAEAVLEKERLERLAFEARRLFGDIPKGYRALLLAVYVRGVSCEEISHRYGVTVRTVYRKLERARQIFRSISEKLSESDFPEVFSLISAMTEQAHA